MFRLSINSPLDSPPVARLDRVEFKCNGALDRNSTACFSRSKVGVILRQPCGSSTSAARRDIPADALRLPRPARVSAQSHTRADIL